VFSLKREEDLMRRTRWIAAVMAAGIPMGGIAMTKGPTGGQAANDAVSKHMVAEATLTAHYVDAALRAGMDRDAINAVLRKIADETVISEFWVSDENGEIAFTNVEGVNFAFPTDPSADSQAAPFAALLTGDETVVAQHAAPRVLDGVTFQYVGVAGVDQNRIVQVGLSVAELDQP
jgi:hypothetical protein